MAGSVEALLTALGRGEEGVFERLVPHLYDELRALARAQRRSLRPGETLDTTALVHETYLKLEGRHLAASSREHLLGILAHAMRQVLVSAARQRFAAKRGGGIPPDSLDVELCASHPREEEILEVEDALGKLRLLDPRLVEVVECRFFAGLTQEETSRALGVSERTIHRDWLRARAWLRRELGRGVL